jgi:hypothetical protein
MLGNSRVAERLLASQEGLESVELHENFHAGWLSNRVYTVIARTRWRDSGWFLCKKPAVSYGIRGFKPSGSTNREG